MTVRKFKFISPGVKVREIDLSERPRLRGDVGAVVIGRSEKGPSLQPVEVRDLEDFYETFGTPHPGGGTFNNDVWRDGNFTSPTYGAFAAQAFLKSKNPLTFVRLAGDQHEQATTAGAAGFPQDGNFTPNTVLSSNAGAYGLFVINSGSLTDYALNTAVTGALGAIFYLKQGCSIRLAGETAYSMSTVDDELSGAAMPIRSTGTDKTFTAVINQGGSNITASFNFNEDSDRFIRKVFNTNPILTNTTVTDSTSNVYKKYWLGETYEDFVNRQVTSGSVPGSVFGIIAPLASGSGAAHGGDFRFKGKRAKTGWVFSQDLTTNWANYHPLNMVKLFRFQTHTSDEFCQKNLKISISNIRSSKNNSDQYGIFDVEIRKIDDNDQSKQVVERFTQCSLNPHAENYISKKIGNTYSTWNYSERRFITYGDYPNNSKFVWVDVNPDVDQAQTDPRLLPFGFYGTPRFKGVTMSRNGIFQTEDLKAGLVRAGNAFVRGTGSCPSAASGSNFGGEGITWGTGEVTGLLDADAVSASFVFPRHPLVVSASSQKTTSPFDAYFGIDVYRNGSSRILAKNHIDIVRALPENYDEDSSANVEVAYYFSLDDVRQASGSSGTTWLADAFYESGSRVLGQSISARGAISPLATLSTSSYESTLNAGFNKFTLPIYGGFEGLDVAEKEPFRNSKLLNGSETTNYAYHSIQRAIDSITDQEVVEYDLATIPGVNDESLTRKLIDVCEERGDALAIIDLTGDYTPYAESTATEANRRGSITTTIQNLKARGLNTSYGCAFYPWVTARDTISNNIFSCPPSIVALGAFANTDNVAEPWFAIGGYNRGLVSEGDAGIPIVNVKESLREKDRDRLYEANINPIAKIMKRIVILGQKTLQVTPSALDRINVRRLLLAAKKRIARISENFLFEQNLQATWDKFEAQVEPYLRSVQARYGLEDFRVVLDETTTTPDLVDQNIMYAKIQLKPAKSIENIGIDFQVLNTGAAGFLD